MQEIFAVTVLPWRYAALVELTDPIMRNKLQHAGRGDSESFAKPDPLADRVAAATAAHHAANSTGRSKIYRAVLAQRPTHAIARFQLGLALTDAERWAEAVE